MRAMEPLSLTNQFLIAMPNMVDPLFARSLIYLCEHGEQGAMGLIINKPSGIALAQLFEQIDLPLTDEKMRTSTVLFGGPVQPDRGFVLHTPIANWQSSLTVTEEIALTTSKDILNAVAEGTGPKRLLVTLGYAGWTNGQLEEEIASNAWLNVQSDLNIMFDTPIGQRYEAAMAILGIDPTSLSGEIGHA